MEPLTKMLIDAIRADAKRHEEGNYGELGCEFDTLEDCRSQQLDSPRDKNFGIAHTFWDSWIDQVRHGFAQNFYRGIAPDDWPSLAREIANNLELETPIENTTILKLFNLAPRVTWWSRVMSWFAKIRNCLTI